MKKMLLAGCLLASAVSANASSIDGWTMVEKDQNCGSSNATQMVEAKVRKGISALNSLTAKGIYGVGRTIEATGTVLNYAGWAMTGIGTLWTAFEKAAVTEMSTALSVGVQGACEYGAWNASSKAVSLGLKDLADTVEAHGAKSSYIGKVMWTTMWAGAITTAVSKGFSWFGGKVCDYAESL